MSQDVIRERRLHQPERILRRNRPRRNGRLRIVGRRKRHNLVDGRKLRRQRLRVARPARRMLVLAAHVQRERSLLVQRREAGNVVEPRLVRPPIVVEERLSQVEAVLQNRARDPLHPRVNGLQPIHHAARGRNLCCVIPSSVSSFSSADRISCACSSSLERIASSDFCRMCSALRRVYGRNARYIESR